MAFDKALCAFPRPPFPSSRTTFTLTACNMYHRLMRWFKTTADAYSTHFLFLIGLVYWMQGFNVRSLEMTPKASSHNDDDGGGGGGGGGMEFQPLGSRRVSKHDTETATTSVPDRKEIPRGTMSTTEVRWRSSVEDLLLHPDEGSGTSHRRAGSGAAEQV